MNTSKPENVLDKSNDEAPKDIYCKSVIPILIQNANDQFMVRKVTNELEVERLKREHAEIDKKIAAGLAKNQQIQEESAEFDRQIYNATQMKNQTRKNEELKKKLQQKKEQFEIRPMKKNKIAEMKKKRKLNLLMKINKRQEENKAKKDELEKKKEDLKRISEEMKAKWNDMEEKLNNKETEKNELKNNLTETIKSCEEKQLKIENLKTNIFQKETELDILKGKCAARQEDIKKENDIKQKEYESEKEKLLIVEKQLQEVSDENARSLAVLLKKTQDLTNLKAKKEELTVQLCDQKMKVITRQYENKELQNRNNIIFDQLRLEQDQMELLETQIEQLEKLRREAKIKFEEYWKEFEEKHNEKIEILLKQQATHKANMEVAQNRLFSGLKEVENLKKEIKDMEEGIEWSEMQYERQKMTLNRVKEAIKREQFAYDTLKFQQKKKLKSGTHEMTETNVPMQGNVNENKAPGILKSKNSPVKVILEPEVLTENNAKEESVSLNGRRPPGILKIPKEPKAPQTPTKRVTFEGIYSTDESSSVSDENKEGRKTIEEETLDDFLKGWNNYISARKKGPKKGMDF